MPKPTEFTRWATGAADVVEPASGTKDVGYLDGAPVDAGELNWILNRIFLWEVWLNAFETTAHHWTQGQVFESTVEFDDDVGFDAAVTFGFGVVFNENVTFNTGTVAFNGLAAFNNGVTFEEAVLFKEEVTIDAALGVFTSNGVANFAGVPTFTTPSHFDALVDINSNVTVDMSNGSAAAIAATNADEGPGGSFSNYGTSATKAALKCASLATGPALEIGAGNAVMTGSNPAGTLAQDNTLTPKHITKAYIRAKLNNTASPLVKKAINVTSIAQESSGDITVTFAASMADSDYLVMCQSDNPLWTLNADQSGPRGPGQFVARYSFTSSGAPVDRTTSNNHYVEFAILGDQ